MKVNKVILCLMGISVILNAAIAIVGPFFPPEAEKKGVELKTIGYIFSAYPMAFVIVSLIMPTILHYTNQRVVFVTASIIYVSTKLFKHRLELNNNLHIGSLSCWIRFNNLLEEVRIQSLI